MSSKGPASTARASATARFPSQEPFPTTPGQTRASKQLSERRMYPNISVFSAVSRFPGHGHPMPPPLRRRPVAAAAASLLHRQLPTVVPLSAQSSSVFSRLQSFPLRLGHKWEPVPLGPGIEAGRPSPARRAASGCLPPCPSSSPAPESALFRLLHTHYFAGPEALPVNQPCLRQVPWLITARLKRPPIRGGRWFVSGRTLRQTHRVGPRAQRVSPTPLRPSPKHGIPRRRVAQPEALTASPGPDPRLKDSNSCHRFPFSGVGLGASSASPSSPLPRRPIPFQATHNLTKLKENTP